MSMENRGGMILTGKNRRIRRETCPSALSSTSPTWTDPGENPDLHSDRSATNCLSHGTVETYSYIHRQMVMMGIKITTILSQNILLINLLPRATKLWSARRRKACAIATLSCSEWWEIRKYVASPYFQPEVVLNLGHLALALRWKQNSSSVWSQHLVFHFAQNIHSREILIVHWKKL
jgi:hypothetical protein